MSAQTAETGTHFSALGLKPQDLLSNDFRSRVKSAPSLASQLRLILPRAFNPGLVYSSDGMVAIGRELKPEVLEAMTGQDDNVLKVYLLGKEGSKELHELVIPSTGLTVVNWEDTRVFQIDQNEGIVGATAKRRNGRDIVNPSLFKVRWENDQLVVVGKPLVLTEIEGKNTTPVDYNYNSIRFLYRDETFHHSLFLMTVEGIRTDSHRLIKEKRINFPKVWWANYKIGTVAEPITTPNGNLLLLLHGQRIENGKHIYSIGVAELTRDFDLLGISRDPIFVRSDFPTKNELHPDEKEVVYACAQIIEGDNILLLVSVGDGLTYLTGPITRHELQDAQMIVSEELRHTKIRPTRFVSTNLLEDWLAYGYRAIDIYVHEKYGVVPAKTYIKASTRRYPGADVRIVVSKKSFRTGEEVKGRKVIIYGA